MKKCFWLYHVTYQPINNKSGYAESVWSFWTIKAKKRLISIKTLKMSRHRKISTVCHFPDLPIEFCEYRWIARVPIFILMSEIVPNIWYLYPVSNGATYKVFGYLHWCANKWRHRYDSYNLNLGIKSSDDELTEYSNRLIIFSLTERL